MGHQRLKSIPRSREWEHVVELLGDGGAAAEIAGASADAINRDLKSAAKDPALTEVAFLLATIPGAAREKDAAQALRDLGIAAGPKFTLLQLVSAIDRAVDRQARGSITRTDLGELAGLAAASSLTNALSPDLPTLFGTTSADLQAALTKLDSPARFGKLARTFFADLTQRSLEYYLSRAYARFVGPGETFASLAEQIAFRDALREHCYESAVILEQYAAEWFSKSKYEGGITRDNAQVFARTALQKLRRELSIRSGSDA